MAVNVVPYAHRGVIGFTLKGLDHLTLFSDEEGEEDEKGYEGMKDCKYRFDLKRLSVDVTCRSILSVTHCPTSQSPT
ncbi:hypothetical protein PsorP6_001671 [Peronosclerospora sorghi]|uniref:Uncharacterized protein n=1 Tax=Peronosclerospora sorghi TaxID=230839 RepID=A0ACC0WWE7_9STRA|nr:hypothetical protein PsorP6_001671 [Peronosclerospora sorghi]